MSAIDVHLISLRPQLEGFIVPSKVYGVLAAGRASVFIGDVNGEVGQMLLGSGCGAVCAAHDTRALCATLQQLHEDVALRERMAMKARDLFCQRYQQHHALAMWQDVFGSIGVTR